MISSRIKKKPQHIFFIVGESLDIWPLLKKYKKIRLYTEINKISKTSFFLNSFLPISNSTVFALSSISSGLPDFKTHLNYKIESKKIFISAISPFIKKFGYTSQFFFGGNLSWQNIGNFLKIQGFKKIYGAEDILNLRNENEWGVDDEILFNFVIKKIKKKRKTFNLIMTTSNHPPYTIILKKLNFLKNKLIQDHINKYGNQSTNPKKIGHHWYNDKCLGKFIKILKKKYTKSLFFITGDHFSKRHLIMDPSVYEKNAVPFFLCGKNIILNMNVPKYSNGNHLDLFATLSILVMDSNSYAYSNGNTLIQNYKCKSSFGNSILCFSNFFIDTRGVSSNIVDTQLLRKYYRYNNFIYYNESNFKINKLGPLGFEPRTKGL